MSVARFSKSDAAGAFLSLPLHSNAAKRRFSTTFGEKDGPKIVHTTAEREAEEMPPLRAETVIRKSSTTLREAEKADRTLRFEAPLDFSPVTRAEISPLRLLPPKSSETSGYDQQELREQIPTPFNINELARDVDGNSTTPYRLEDLVVTLVHHCHGLKALIRLLHVFEAQDYSHRFGGKEQVIRDKYTTCEMVAVQRTGTSVLIAIDMHYHVHEAREINPDVWIKYRVRPNGTWNAYACGLGWAINDSTNAEDLNLCKTTLTRFILAKISRVYNSM